MNHRHLSWDRNVHTECCGVKHVNGNPTLPLTWERGVTVHHKYELLKSVEN